ncbi:MAG: hypothetical protein EU531_02450 [Promethearchaeota archaeon]|nr:MAG: hypothetical protein EU531_02450 [Candidatus Lokiarchaeota archaeon]
MSLESKYLKIQQFLSFPDEKFELPQKIDSFIKSEDIKIEILSKIHLFIRNFSMFRDVEFFMESVYQCIEHTLEMEADTINDFNNLLIKNSLMRFIQDYIDYAQLTQKRQLLRLLSDSLDKLQIQPLFINLGLMLKPIYQDTNYLENLKTLNEKEINYNLNDNLEITIKNDIDNWLRTSNVTLDNQEECRKEMLEYYDFLVAKYNLSIDSKKYLTLKTEIIEMLSMKLTLLSLMNTLLDESTNPLPIR